MINWSTNIVLAYFKKTKQFFNLFRNSIIMIGLEWSVHFAHDVRFIMFSAIIKTISITITYYKGCLELLFQLFFFSLFFLGENFNRRTLLHTFLHALKMN